MTQEEEVFIFPASFAQARLWFIDQLVPGKAFYNVSAAIRLMGRLNAGALEETFNEIVRRHEVLRTTFKMVDGQLVQAIAQTLTIPLSIVNLQLSPAAEREAEALPLVTAFVETAFDLSRGALLRVMLVKLDETEQVLVLNMHHIVADDWSIGVLMREITAIYTRLVEDPPLPPLTKGGSKEAPLTKGGSKEVPLQYADFAVWQREWLQGEVLETQLAYWRQQLDGISVLNLPTDRSKPDGMQTYRGATEFLELPPQLTEQLEMLSVRSSVTLFMTLLAAFQTLLYRYAQQEDIAIGVAIANRSRSELESLIGFFVNNLVMRVDLSGNPTFLELLGRVKEMTLGAYAHQDLPFEKLVEEISPERSLSRHPLFQSVFSFQNAPSEALELPGLEASFMDIEAKTTRFDLELHLWKSEENFRSLWGGERWQYSEGIRGAMVYSTDLFDKSTITRMLGHFHTLLEGIVANPEQHICNLPILTASERHQLLVEFNQYYQAEPGRLAFPGGAWERVGGEAWDSQAGRGGVSPPWGGVGECINRVFEAQVEVMPDAIAAVFRDKEITYRELNSKSNQLAHYLNKLGVREEVVVGLCLEPSIEMIVGMLGILKAGGAYLSLDPAYPAERLSFMLADAAAPVLLIQEKLAKKETFAVNNPIFVYLDRDWETIAQESEENSIPALTGENLAYIIYTSGSTGKPKGVEILHKGIIQVACNNGCVFLERSDKMAQVSNISFDAAALEIWGALLNGAQLIGISRDIILSPQEFALEIRQKSISVLFLTTALFQQMAKVVPEAFGELRILLFGGESVSPSGVRKVLKNNPPKQLFHLYGPAETTTFSTCYLVQDVPESAISIPIGRAIAKTEVYLLDSQQQPVPIGVTGELYIGGVGLARGYRNSETRFLFETGFLAGVRLYKTGDKARYLATGNIEFLGRIDNQVKIRGFRVELGEIEAVLSQHPKVAETVVIIREEVPGNKQLVAYVVPHFQPEAGLEHSQAEPGNEGKEPGLEHSQAEPGNEGKEPGLERFQAEPGLEHSQAEPGNEGNEVITSISLRQFLREKLPEYMIPSAYIAISYLPLTPNGKIDRHLLPAIDTVSAQISEDYVAPQTSIEEALAGIWAKVLGVKQVGVHDNFFEVGGHSLLATQLISRIRDALLVELTVRNLFETPTVASMAEYIETIRWAAKGADTNRLPRHCEEGSNPRHCVTLRLALGVSNPLEINKREEVEF